MADPEEFKMSGELNIEEILLMLRVQADRTPHIEMSEAGGNPSEVFGGNFDDTYFGGVEDGETNLARLIVSLIDGGKLKI